MWGFTLLYKPSLTYNTNCHSRLKQKRNIAFNIAILVLKRFGIYPIRTTPSIRNQTVFAKKIVSFLILSYHLVIFVLEYYTDGSYLNNRSTSKNAFKDSTTCKGNRFFTSVANEALISYHSFFGSKSVLSRTRFAFGSTWSLRHNLLLLLTFFFCRKERQSSPPFRGAFINNKMG